MDVMGCNVASGCMASRRGFKYRTKYCTSRGNKCPSWITSAFTGKAFQSYARVFLLAIGVFWSKSCSVSWVVHVVLFLLANG